MPQANAHSPSHPGAFIRDNIIPSGLTVKAAAELLGVGRPALSNLLNGKAALSPEMALRLEKTFGASQQELMQIQAQFDQNQARSRGQDVAVRSFVPSFLNFTAADIESWAGSLQARSRLPVLLRRLIQSTVDGLTLVDFPGYDNSERKGWDGLVDARATSLWVPTGKSGWEFGCNEDPKQKADDDFSIRTKGVPSQERSQIHFRFVTPRNWKGKEKWSKDKQALGEWRSVRAYDASDLEQWLEQSVSAQGWFAEQTGVPTNGVSTLEEEWHVFASVTEPELSPELFGPSVQHYLQLVKSWLENEPSCPLIVCADSKIEALAFLHCMFGTSELSRHACGDRALVFYSPNTLRRLLKATQRFLPVIASEEAEREVGGLCHESHTIIIRPRNTVDPKPSITLDPLGAEAFRKALVAMGIEDQLRVQSLARECGYSPSILRRRLSNIPAIRTPSWAQATPVVRKLIPMMLVGAWHTQSKGDCEIISFLADVPYHEIEKQITELSSSDDPPIWSVGVFRGIVSKIDAFYAVQAVVTEKNLTDFLKAAEVVLSEKDPALELPEGRRALAGFFGKTPQHSGALREGICETLILLAVHGKDLFGMRMGIDIEARVNGLIRSLLTPLTIEKLRSHAADLPLYAEAAPREFIALLEEDLKSPEPQLYGIMNAEGTGLFGTNRPRNEVLWALEGLAWRPEQLVRVLFILARLAEHKATDNSGDKPEGSLRAIFRSWMPQTAAPLDQRKKALEVLAKRFPGVAWRICVDQFAPGHRSGHYSHRPRWRNDASGAGQHATWGEIHEFGRWALDLAMDWDTHDENTLGDLIANLEGVPREEQPRIWELVRSWGKEQKDQARKAVLREHIRGFAFTTRAKDLDGSSISRNHAREAYNSLEPTDVVIRHRWLFQSQWLSESFDELEDPTYDYHRREERVRQLRITALKEIWQARGFDGIQELVTIGGSAGVVGWHLAFGGIAASESASLLERCLRAEGDSLPSKMQDLVRLFLAGIEDKPRNDLIGGLLTTIPSSLRCRFLICCPFERETWQQVDRQGQEVGTRYWMEVQPDWMFKNSPDLNEVVDRLVDARRPRAAFHAVHFVLEEIETSRLKRLLHELGTCGSEAAGSYRLDAHDLATALTVLQSRTGVTEDEMARLELQFITALEHTAHGMPNLERHIGRSPALFVQALAIIFRRRDGGEDPPEWQIKEENQTRIATTAYSLLANLTRVPGAGDDGRVDEQHLRAWIKEARSLCSKYGRSTIGDQRLGQLLAVPLLGEDGIWPCEPIRNVLEEVASPDIATGLCIGVCNLRGGVWRGEGGNQERDLATKYRAWARRLAFEYPYVADVVEKIASMYDREAEGWDSEAAVRRRIQH